MSHVESYYSLTAGALPACPELAGDERADVAVIGGGYTGLSAALHLAEKGLDVVLLEAERIGWGASGRNGGQVGSGQRRPVEELEERYGKDSARRLLELGNEAKALVKSLVHEHGIDCGLRPGIIDAAHKRRLLDGYRRHVGTMQDSYGYPHLRFVEGEAFRELVASPDYHGGIVDSDAAHLHPLRFAAGLAKAAEAAGARLYELSRVIGIDTEQGIRLATSKAVVRAGSAIIACNGYLGRLEPRLARKILPINNFIIATEPLGAERARALIRDDAAVCDSRWVINYFRLSEDHRLLFGGGESYGAAFPSDIKALVRPRMLEIFPQLADARIDYGWGGTLGITPIRLPCLTRLGPDLLAAGGYSGHGISIATLAGKLCAEAIAGQVERFDIMAAIDVPDFPGGTFLRKPLLVLAMLWGKLRDRI